MKFKNKINTKIWGLIPARLESSRFPRKALEKIIDYPLVIHVALRSRLCTLIDEVAVCTDSKEIAQICSKYDVSVILTQSSHRNGTERISEAADILNIPDCDTIIDIQGDEALVDPFALSRLIKFFQTNKYQIVVPYNSVQNANDENRVKIIESQGRVLYMTRAAAPHPFTKNSVFKKHLSTVAFTGKALRTFSKLPIGDLEKIESIELLRGVEANLSIGTFREVVDTLAVDNHNDLEQVKRIMAMDSYHGKY